MAKDLPLVVNFNEVNRENLGLVGGKGANLGELTQAGFQVPPGFIVTSAAYFNLIEINQLKDKIRQILKTLDKTDIKSLNTVSRQIKKLLLTAPVPENLAAQIIKNYLKLGRGLNNTLVAVRSSATAEDLPDASFAGQQETFLNIKGEANLIQAIRDCWASLFEPRAIFYREEKGFDHFQVGIAVPVQQMIQSEVAGIMFTVNPVTGDKNQIVIEAVWGLGETIVQGTYTPDHYLVQKLSWKILQKQVNHQVKALTLSKSGNQEKALPFFRRRRAKLSEQQIISVAQLGQKVQNHYFFPQDIEWALYHKKFYLVQSRPITTLNINRTDKKISTQNLKLILKGESASPGMAYGLVRVLNSAREINLLKPQEILVAPMTTPDFVPAMKKAAGIITDKGGQTSHAAIVSRELGVPCLVGAANATKLLKTGQAITLNATDGLVYQGGRAASEPRVIPVRLKPQKKLDKKSFSPDFLPTATKLYVNLGEPDLAATIAQKNVDGVGLLRAEFMLAQIGIHPKKLISDNRSAELVNGLTDGLTKFCRAFYPRPVVYRTTDFKTNEYANLIGGKAFEPEEANPLIGYRGAYRYLCDPKVFFLELKAIRHVRESLGFKNLWLMLPFVRTVDQLIQVKKMINDQGLTRGPNFKLWLMVEIPSNVILLEKFISAGIDGVSIGSNDLTMLLLGVDRDNSEVAPVYNELDPAVLWAIEKTITTCQRLQITSSICGQAPSVYPDLTEKLVSWGVSSVSVSPDMIDQTRNIIHEAERKHLHAKTR